jgi:hypothetical protein
MSTREVCAIEDYDFSYNAKIPTARIRDLATLRFIEAGESVVLHGPVGVGKTMIAQALGHLACRRGHNVAFTKASRLLADLAGGHADRTWEARLRRWARPAVLIIDDFAMRSFTPAQSDDLYELITERAGKSLITTANRAATDWYSLFPNAVVAESILDRVVNSFTFTWTESRTGPTHAPVRRRASRERAQRSAQGVCCSRLPRAITGPERPRPAPHLLLTELPAHQPRSKLCPQGRSRPRRRRRTREAHRPGVARQIAPGKRRGGCRHRAWTALSRPSGRSDHAAHRQASTGAGRCDEVERMAGAQWWIT